MKVLLVFDQGLAGVGGKSNPNVGLHAEYGGIGSALMLQPHFDKIGAEVLATMYCGNEYFVNNKEEVILKMTAMAKKLNPDFVICGPCFNFIDYGLMSAMLTENIMNKTDIPVCTIMSKENEETIASYKDKIPILKMPKKGGTGLNESIDNLCQYITAIVDNNDTFENLKNKYCY